MKNKKKETINVLEKWYKNALYISSEFLIKRTVNRSKIEFIYHTLKDTFGEVYFEAVAGQDRPIEKISWIYSLLANENHIGCIGGLDLIAGIIRHTENLAPSIRKGMMDKIGSPKDLRSYFFELFIFYFLDKKGLPNQKKIMEGNQEKEGTFVLNGKEFLYECRLAFLPNMLELDTMRRLLVLLNQLIPTINKPLLQGMICSLSFARPVTGSHLPSFEQKIREFIGEINRFEQNISGITYTAKNEFGVFKAEDYNIDTALLIENENKHDVAFLLVPPDEIIPNEKIWHNGKVLMNFSLARNKVYEKLETALKEKKKQHKNSAFENRIIFIDVEIFPEFHMSLFPQDNMLQEEEVKRIYDKMRLTEILCIVRRKYIENIPTVSTSVFYPEHLKIEALKLKEQLEGFIS